MIGQPGELYAVAQNFGGQTRFLASGSPEDVKKPTIKLAWVMVRGVAKPFTYQDAQALTRALPNSYVVRAIVVPSPQQELPLWV
ncbi:MAG: hypothetical protein ACFUZC_07255 [Chthoniobacteraceae bacterium]